METAFEQKQTLDPPPSTPLPNTTETSRVRQCSEYSLPTLVDPRREPRGQASEALFEKALNIVIDRQKKCAERGKPNRMSIPLIDDYVHAEPNSFLDRNQIDFLLKCRQKGTTEDLGFQIKSSKRGANKFIRLCRKLKIYRCLVVVPPGEMISRVINRLIKAIQLFFNKLKHKMDRHAQIVNRKNARLESRITGRKCKHKPWPVRFHAASMCH